MERRCKELNYDLTYKEVVDVLKLINESESCRELRLEMGDMKLTIVRDGNGINGSSVEAPVNYTASSARDPQEVVLNKPAETVPVIQVAGPEKQTSEQEEGLVQRNTGVSIKAPMLGTFYRALAPGESPFVEVGSKVEPDDIVGIIDVMKLMNTIKAGQRGVVREICVENEEMVEFNQILIILDPIDGQQ